MQFSNFFKLTNFLTMFPLVFFCFAGFNRGAYANDSSTFKCIQPGDKFPPSNRYENSQAEHPTIVMDNEQYGIVKILQWVNEDFLPKNNRLTSADDIRYDPATRCNLVANRFNDFYECNVLTNIVQKSFPLQIDKQEYPAIFVSLDGESSQKQEQKNCLQSKGRIPAKFDSNKDLYLLFMLSKNDPRQINRELCFVRGLLRVETLTLLDSDKELQAENQLTTQLVNSSTPTQEIYDINLCFGNVINSKQ